MTFIIFRAFIILEKEPFFVFKFVLIGLISLLLSMNSFLKGQCHEIFDFSLIEPIWSPDKQAEMVFLKDSFSQRYSNLKFDSAQANTAHWAESKFFDKLDLLKANKKCWAILQ